MEFRTHSRNASSKKVEERSFSILKHHSNSLLLNSHNEIHGSYYLLPFDAELDVVIVADDDPIF